MALLLVLRPAGAIPLALSAIALARFRGAGIDLFGLLGGIAALTVVLNALTEPGPPLVEVGPLALTRTGLAAGGERAARLAGLAAVGWLLARELGGERLAEMAVRAAWPLERRWPRVAGLGLAAGLALRFLPEIGHEVERLRLAAAARPPRVRGGGMRNAGARGEALLARRIRLAELESLFLPLLAGSVRRAGEVARTLDARGFGSGPPTPAAALPLTGRARWLAAAMVAGATLAVAADRFIHRG